MDSRKKKHFSLHFSLVALLVLAVLVVTLLFQVRAPLVIVSDPAFESLYGKNRALLARLRLSLRTVRPVNLVLVPDTAQLAAVAASLASSAAKKMPACVLTPARYGEIAVLLAASEANLPVMLLGECPDLPPDMRFLHIKPDRQTDVYRAGRLAGLLAGKKQIKLCLPAESQGAALTEFFVAGCSDAAYQGQAQVIFAEQCASQGFSAGDYIVDLSFTDTIPVAQGVFSWLDPSFFSAQTQFQFDDSVYALALPALAHIHSRGQTVKLPSQVRVFLRTPGMVISFGQIQVARHSRRH